MNQYHAAAKPPHLQTTPKIAQEYMNRMKIQETENNFLILLRTKMASSHTSWIVLGPLFQGWQKEVIEVQPSPMRDLNKKEYRGKPKVFLGKWKEDYESKRC